MSFLNKFKTFFNKSDPNESPEQTHFAHGVDFKINKKAINRNAIKVTKRLTDSDYKAFLVGGSVRDLLLHHTPKDFDVATNATPEQVRKLFRNCRLIGRRFRLAHVYFSHEIIEVATFRTTATKKKVKKHLSDDGMILRDNVYGTLEQDAWRRDFTINALYYDIQQDLIVDYTGGLEDIKHRQIHIIGDPIQRYREDPVRMLRAIRFAAKLSFDIAPTTASPFTELKDLLWNVSSARLFEEVLKLFFSGHAKATYEALCTYDFFGTLFPQAADALVNDPQLESFLIQGLVNTDERIQSERSINPAFLFAVILWGPYQEEIRTQRSKTSKLFIARQNAAQNVLQQQAEILSIPKRITHVIKEIWDLQYRLPRRYGKRAYHSYTHQRFRAGYDFLLLRSQFDIKWKELADWWTAFQEVDEDERQTMIKALN